MLSASLIALVISSAAQPVFVPPKRAHTLIEEGATVLDARGLKASSPYLPRAVSIEWMTLRDGLLRTGRLSEDLDDLRESLEERGVDRNRPVVVYGAMGEGWGEEGRIWWMLRYLGHPQVFIVDGGIQGWSRAGLETWEDDFEPEVPGRFPIERRGSLRIEARALERERLEYAILDTRTGEEFAGDTPYLSSRGGHIPGARHLYWKELIGKDGRLLPVPTIREKLSRLGIAPHAKIATYCTGGVRSAFVQAALLHAGFGQVRNYDGSWWDWAAQDALPVER